MTMSGWTSLISEIARSRRLGRKYCFPQCRSESWTIVNGAPFRPCGMVRVYEGRRDPNVSASEVIGTVSLDAGNACFPGIFGCPTAPLRQPRGTRVCEGARLLMNAPAVRAANVRARGGRDGPHGPGVHARLLSAGAGSLHRDHDDEAVARDAEEPQAAQAPRALPRGERQAVLQARHRAPGRAIQAADRLIEDADPRIGEIYLSAEEIEARVAELGAEIARD